jgi:hypothetical protein
VSTLVSESFPQITYTGGTVLSRAFDQQVKFGNAVLRQIPFRCCLMAPVCRSTFTPLDFSVNSPHHSPVECKHGSRLRFGPRDFNTQFPRFVAAFMPQVLLRCNQKRGQLKPPSCASRFSFQAGQLAWIESRPWVRQQIAAQHYRVTDVGYRMKRASATRTTNALREEHVPGRSLRLSE